MTELVLLLQDKPFVFFGHSMGALLSFELARQLRRLHGMSPVHIFVSGHGAPQIARESSLSSLPEPEFLEKLRDLNGTPREVLEHPELREVFIPILRADFAVGDSYVWQSEDPLDCPISAFGGLADTHVRREQLDAWREQTRASFTLRMFPGDHFFVNTARSLVIDALVRELTRYWVHFPERSSRVQNRAAMVPTSR